MFGRMRWRIRFYGKRAGMLLRYLLARSRFKRYYEAEGIKFGFRNVYHHSIVRSQSKDVIEKDFLPLWKEKARFATVVYDIGGFNGFYGLIAAKVNPNARVIIFEPDAVNYEQIRENIALNHLPNCSVERVALSDASGTVPFQTKGTTYARIGEGPEHVKTARLETYPAPALLKIDAAGAESRIIAGAGPTLSARPPIFLQTDTVDSEHEAMWKRLAETGYIVRQTAVLPTGGRYIAE